MGLSQIGDPSKTCFSLGFLFKPTRKGYPKNRHTWICINIYIYYMYAHIYIHTHTHMWFVLVVHCRCTRNGNESEWFEQTPHVNDLGKYRSMKKALGNPCFRFENSSSLARTMPTESQLRFIRRTPGSLAEQRSF